MSVTQKQIVEALRARPADGYSDIAKDLGIYRQRVRTAAKNYGLERTVTTPRKHTMIWQLMEMVARDTKLSTRELANKFGVHRSLVCRARQRARRLGKHVPPIIDEMMSVTPLDNERWAKRSGLALSTVRTWRNGTVNYRPIWTLCWMAEAIGYRVTLEKIND